MGRQKRSENTYQKINTLYKRDEKGKIMPWESWVEPELEWMRKLKFEATEKIDGTNMRFEVWPTLVTDEDTIAIKFEYDIKGKTDNGNIRKELYQVMEDTFVTKLDDIVKTFYKVEKQVLTVSRDDENTELVELGLIAKLDGDWRLGVSAKKVTFYGEGYGEGIRDKFHYCHGNRYIGFDIKVGETYLLPEVRRQIFEDINIECVPFIGWLNIDEAVALVYNTFKTNIGDTDEIAEGIILSSPFGVRFRNSGERIMVKIKVKDFKDYLNKYPENEDRLTNLIVHNASN